MGIQKGVEAEIKQKKRRKELEQGERIGKNPKREEKGRKELKRRRVRYRMVDK